MSKMETGIRDGCVILPFTKRDLSKTNATTTTLAALLAVTVIHDSDISAEERLIEIIEKNGDVEVLDAEDVLADMGLKAAEPNASPTVCANDNLPFKVT